MVLIVRDTMYTVIKDVFFKITCLFIPTKPFKVPIFGMSNSRLAMCLRNYLLCQSNFHLFPLKLKQIAIP